MIISSASSLASHFRRASSSSPGRNHLASEIHSTTDRAAPFVKAASEMPFWRHRLTTRSPISAFRNISNKLLFGSAAFHACARIARYWTTVIPMPCWRSMCLYASTENRRMDLNLFAQKQYKAPGDKVRARAWGIVPHWKRAAGFSLLNLFVGSMPVGFLSVARWEQS